MSNVMAGNLYVLGVTLFFVVIGLVMLSAKWRRAPLSKTMETIVEPKAGKSVPLFDTLRYFKRLCDAGIPEAHAEAMTEALVVALNEAFSESIRRRKLQGARDD